MRPALPRLLALMGLLLSCGPPPGPEHRGTYEATAWPTHALRPARSVQGLTERIGEVVILQGDETLISGQAPQLGLRFDDARNDLGAITARFVAEVADPEATLVLFTTFDDRGGGGPAYFVPIFNDTQGTGLGPVQQRALFGVRNLTGIINMKRLESRPADQRLPLLVHEVAHPDLAYLEARPAAGSTQTPTLLGRQGAHWHAALNTEGSVLGGHGYVQVQPGRFVVNARNSALSALDLYGLGLLDPSEVPPFFLIEGARTEAGFSVPIDAQLGIGDVIFGTAQRIGIEQITAALGPRARQDGPRHLVFALLTAPSLASTSSTARAEAQRIDDLRQSLQQAWPDWTRQRGQLCTQLDGCRAPDPTDAGQLDAGHEVEVSGCTTASPGSIALGVLLAGPFMRRRRTKKKSPGQH